MQVVGTAAAFSPAVTPSPARRRAVDSGRRFSRSCRSGRVSVSAAGYSQLEVQSSLFLFPPYPFYNSVLRIIYFCYVTSVEQLEMRCGTGKFYLRCLVSSCCLYCLYIYFAVCCLVVGVKQMCLF